MKTKFFTLLLIVLATAAFSQEEEVDLFELSLEELLNQKVTVASRRAISQREAPGILSVISADDIEKNGARDMIDVLRLVPGFNFNFDVEGVVGVSIRGNWGHEGKVLLMLDGQEMNEILYSTTIFGGHFPIDQIHRIEIIRGPGSSIYGGYAELGVINIITKSGEQIEGVQASSMVSLMGDDIGTTYLNFNAGQKKGDFEISLLGNYGISRHTYNEKFVDFYGGEVLLSGSNAQNEALWLNLGFSYKDLSGRVIYDGYNITASTLFDDVTPEPYNLGFGGLYAELKYQWKINNKITLTPQYNFKQQNPWASDDQYGDSLDMLGSKHTGGLHFNADFFDFLNLIAGAEASFESTTDRFNTGRLLEGAEKVSFNNISAYAQGMFMTKYFNFFAGGRMDRHNVFGGALAPRLGFTKSFSKFHYKALYSHAFRSPGVMNISLEPNIEPETTIVYELEAGYRFTPSTMLSVNLFDITISKPIIYFYDDINDVEGYFNGDKTGTLGSEINFRWQKGQNNLQLGYSAYFAAGKNKVETYSVTGNSNAMVGIPQHKLNITSSWKVINGLFINPQVVAFGKRWAYTEVDTNGDPVLNEVNASLLVNFNILYKNALTPGLDVSCGVYDLLNTKPSYYQAYNGYHPPYPGKHREIFVKILYNFAFQK